MDTAAGGTANARIARKKELFVISGSPINIGKIDQALADSMPIQVYGGSKQYAFRYDPKLLVGRDALIIGRRGRLDGIDRSLADSSVVRVWMGCWKSTCESFAAIT
jgi:hypothetical protein